MAGAADGRVRVYPVPGKGTLAPHPSIHPDAPSGQYHLAARQLGVVASCPLLNPYARNARSLTCQGVKKRVFHLARCFAGGEGITGELTCRKGTGGVLMADTEKQLLPPFILNVVL
ncbi:unnamed protein product [Mesocestoides corti]|uniref:Uncharacterized protein n=1 Tax=Mesocestoides corti TaxID=53468 RepID=A0A0R3UH41_MESCO|nr:unnamed protein product [Mesocestoides corti]